MSAIDPYIYHACGSKKEIGNVNSFHILKAKEGLRWGELGLNVYIIGQSHFIEFDFDFVDLCSCTPFPSKAYTKIFSVRDDFAYHLPEFYNKERQLKIKIQGRAMAGISHIEDEPGGLFFTHDFGNEALTKIVFSPVTKQSSKACYKTLHTYTEYDRSLETRTEIISL